MKRPTVNFAPEAWVPLKDLKPHPRNPRADLTQHKSKFASLKRSIKEGVFEAVKVSRLTGLCLAGHQRLKAFEALGYEEVPVQYNDCADEREEVQIMIKDNNEWGFYEYEELGELMTEFELDSSELGLSSTDLGQLEGFLGEAPSGDELTQGDDDKKPKMTLTFETFEDMENAKVEIEEILNQYNGAKMSVSGGEL